MDREEFYNTNGYEPRLPKVKITQPAAGILREGFDVIATPAERDSDFHIQTKADRAKVSTPFHPGPGKQHHGKASPSSRESWSKTKPNHEYRAR